MRLNAIAMLLPLSLLQSGPVGASAVSQIDNFEDGTLQSWGMGFNDVTASHITNIASGGPAGAGDHFLEVVAYGAAAAGGRLTFFNKFQWAEDFTGAGITSVSMDLKNFGSSEPLNMRLAINSGVSDPNNVGNFIGGLFATSASASLVSCSDWEHVESSLNPDDLVPVGGKSGVTGNDVLTALGNAKELRLLRSPIEDWTGQSGTTRLGIDNISAAVVPLPSAALLFGSGLIGFCSLLLRGRYGRQQ